MTKSTMDSAEALDTARLFKEAFTAAEPLCKEEADGVLVLKGAERTIAVKAKTDGKVLEIVGFSLAHDGPSFMKCINIERAGFTGQQAIELGKSIAKTCRSIADKKLD